MQTSIDPVKVLKEADCLFNKSEVELALDKMAASIEQNFKNKNPIVLCVLTGAIIPMGHLLTRLNFPLQIDYIHATRYKNGIAGGDIQWLAEPIRDIRDRDVLLIDDILDEGKTLKAIIEYCRTKNAKSIKTAVLVNKLHDRKENIKADFVGLDVEDRYLFGCGMDYKSYLRNILGIYAVKGL
ncbi:Hypoxanthine-guanine phosphoribosyltransferase [hydrothermal vent metagenome]|uniref:Hypoxanthine-guanine phosphoribosyltransferase n=1 Tax=hydrothermal vent metagenome TaxID=652676 RepID=A0A3B0ZWF1_9ZZZZ